MAPEAIAAKSSSANNATADSDVSTIPALLFPSTSRDVGTVSSKAVAAGRMAYNAKLAPIQNTAEASSPLTSFLENE